MRLFVIYSYVTCFVFMLFQESYNVKYFKEKKRLKSLQRVEAHLEPKHLWPSFFVNILNGRSV